MASFASDLRLNLTLSPPITVWGEGATLDAIKQRLTVALSTQLGEWAKDSTYGIDWVGALSTRPFPVEAVLIAIKRQALTVDGVQSVTDLLGSTASGVFTASATIFTVAGVLALETGEAPPVDRAVLGPGPWFHLYPRGGGGF